MNRRPIATNHAKIRAQQRSAPPGVQTLVLTFGDIELPQARGCRSLQLSRVAVLQLLESGHPLANVEAAARTVLILDREDRIVTIIKAEDRKRRTHKMRVRRQVRR